MTNIMKQAVTCNQDGQYTLTSTPVDLSEKKSFDSLELLKNKIDNLTYWFVKLSFKNGGKNISPYL